MNETLKRAISGAVYIILLIACILYSTESFFLLFGIFLLIAVFEFSNLMQFGKILPLLLAVGCYGIVTYLLFARVRLDRTFDIILLSATFLVSVKAIIFLFNDSQSAVNPFSKYVYLFGYIIFPFIAITKITFGKLDPNSMYTLKDYNPKILIGIFILIWTNDTFAYIVGKSIGRHKLFEKISPKKTIEGFIGGLLFALFGSFLIAKYFLGGSAATQNIWFGLALILSVFGTIGDLVESKFKRIAGVKDSGRIMPGHGGILDRLDSIIFAAPFVFIFYQILYFIKS